ncbi:(Fe-S)-binding protein [Campylobacter pinnipediorum]|uniref:(Fe-S)-binding protein n=1 Tax=Campylobacter pinnipediorum TaxID=1965231 RepID=UPI000995C7AE|nr:(Fe-S)-binding protein [Campylobacter pinnipediorum]AQW83043.1 NAD-independent L-lactate dehydrogenase LldEFG, oxidoreductase subunit [Campylobacter pinnipediorum subsp. pinnipediorum]
MNKKVYLYSTCLGSATMGITLVSAIKLLQREGIEVIYKKDQTCCGQPSYNTGYFEESKKIALYNADLFKGDYPILVPSGSCTGVMKHDYLELFHGDKNEEKIKEFSSRVVELSVYLDQVLGVKYEDKGEPVKITWHSNCHALRVAKSIDSSKNLLKQLSNVELVELKYEEECCGFGGTFSVKEPEISDAMAIEKMNDINNAGVKYLVSADGGCMLNIYGTLKRQKSDVKLIHLYDFLLNRIQGEAL